MYIGIFVIRNLSLFMNPSKNRCKIENPKILPSSRYHSQKCSTLEVLIILIELFSTFNTNHFVSYLGDGYFEKPFNKTHPTLSKIKTLTVEDCIKRAIKD